MIASCIGTTIVIPSCYIFMYTFNFGIYGLYMAAGLKDFIQLIITVIYCHRKPEIRKVMQPYDCETFRGWGEYLKISLPATVMICAEWWAFEILTVMAGMLGVLELSSQVIA